MALSLLLQTMEPLTAGKGLLFLPGPQKAVLKIQKNSSREQGFLYLCHENLLLITEKLAGVCFWQRKQGKGLVEDTQKPQSPGSNLSLSIYQLCDGCGNFKLRYGTLSQFSRKQCFIVPAQTQQTHVQRLSPKNKGSHLIYSCK
jgi:hypothetical protein